MSLVEFREPKLYLYSRYFLFISFLHLFHSFEGHLLLCFFILLCLLIYINFRFSVLLAVLFKNLTAFLWRSTLLHVIKSETWNVCPASQKGLSYIRYKNIQMECGESFYKKVAWLHYVTFTLQHFDWVFYMISGCEWMYNF